MKKLASVFFLISPVLLAAVNSQAVPQSTSAGAHLTGTLTDPSGAAVANVHITAKFEPSSGAQVISSVSSPDGSYTLSLPPGRYRIRFSGDSFAPRDVTLDLGPGQSRVMNLLLELAPLSDSVIVTAQTVPITVQQTTAPAIVISREVIEQRQTDSLPNLLLFSPGVAIGRTGAFGGSASLFLNGGNSAFTKILVDGTPINSPGSAVDFSSLTTENIDKVEIVRGAESAIYGTDAVSGVVQLFTHRGETRIPAFSLYSEGGSYSSARGGADLSGLLGKLDYSGAASYFQTDGQGPNDSFLNRTLSGNFGYSFSDSNQLRLSLRNNTTDAGIPGHTVFTPPSLYQGYDQHLFSSNVRWDFATGSHWRHQISGTESYTRQHSFNSKQSYFATDPIAFCPQANPMAVPTAEFCDFTYDALLKFNRAGFGVQSTYILRSFSATAGYQYEVENGEVSFVSPGHLRRNNKGGYLDFRYSPVSRLSLDFGVRAEANDNFGTRVVPRLGGSYVLHYGKGFWGDTRYHAFYGQGIKEPRFDQLYSDKFGDFGNPLLKPEASKNFSTGIEQKLANDRVILSGEYFSNRFYDIVSFAYCTPAFPCGTLTFPGFPNFGYFFNTDRARARGTNIAVEARPLPWLMLMGNYSYDDTLVIASPNAFDPSEQPGNHLLRRPPHSGSLTMNAAFRRLNVTLAGYFSGVRTDIAFLPTPIPPRNPGYARFDISTRYNLGHGLSLYARATNLFDKFYQDALGYPALGRDVRVGMNYRFSGRN